MVSPARDDYPENPVVVRVRRGQHVESVQRGAWCLVDGEGRVEAGAGNHGAAFYVRSSIKPIQALPLLETGAAERFGFTDEELALAVASHSGEACHTERVSGVLARLGLGESALRCGAHEPTDPVARAELKRRAASPSPLHNNCSGKHAGFLALALHLGVPPERYLEPASEGQELVRRALHDLTDAPEGSLASALDGCSAPTFRVPLRDLAKAFARVTTPRGLAPARARSFQRLNEAVAKHPVLLAGSRGRLDTDVVRASAGRLLAKVGAEAVYVVGERGADRALAVKLDDGGTRGLFLLVVALLERFGFLRAPELQALAGWRETVQKNHAGLVVGALEPVVP